MTQETHEDSATKRWRRRNRLWDVGLIAALALTLVWGLGQYVDKRSQASLVASEYGVDNAFVGGRTLDKSSWFDGITLMILQDKQMFTCKHVHAEDIRAGKPITCEGGAVFYRKS